MSSNLRDKAFDRLFSTWWAKVLVGFVLIVFGISTYQHFARIESGESEPGVIRRNDEVLYQFGGKYLAGGVPTVAGLAMIAWGVIQNLRAQPQANQPSIRRTIGRASAVRTPATVTAGAPVSSGEPSYAQSIYLLFWKPIFLVVNIIQMALAILLVRAIWPDPPGYAYGLTMLLVVPVAYLELEAFARWMNWNDEPIIDWRLRATWFLTGGYVLALALTLFLLVQETNQRSRARAAAVERETERARVREITQNPNFKRANEFYRRRQGSDGNAQ